jgi:hypothetical protein
VPQAPGGGAGRPGLEGGKRDRRVILAQLRVGSRRVDNPGGDVDSEIAQAPDAIDERRVARDQEPALACAERLSGMQAEYDVHSTPGALASKAAGSVDDDGQTRIVAEAVPCVCVLRAPERGYGHHGVDPARRDRGARDRRREQPASRIDVANDRPEAAAEDGSRGCDKGEIGQEHARARRKADREQCEL